MNMKVLNDDTLLNYLLNNKCGKSKNNIKSLLKNKCIYVNNKCVTRFDYKIYKNDVISVKQGRCEVDILYEDNDLIAVNKEAGLLTVSIDNKNTKTLYKEVSKYVKTKNKNNKVFIVNRLDRDTSGIVLFAKNQEFKYLLQGSWNEIVRVRKYDAIVHGCLKSDGHIENYLTENKEHIVYSSNTGKKAITDFKVVKSKNEFSYIEVYLSTGRKNQIRVHLKEYGHPIVGDRKYGIKDNSKRLMLHASYLEFLNPKTNKIIKINCDCPFKNFI